MTPGRPHRPKKSLGQNFLVDKNLQRKIVDAVGAGPDDTVVEIGPGQGALTEHLEDLVRPYRVRSTFRPLYPSPGSVLIGGRTGLVRYIGYGFPGALIGRYRTFFVLLVRIHCTIPSL